VGGRALIYDRPGVRDLQQLPPDLPVSEKVFYPVSPPDRNGEEVVEWLTRRR
jgi:hypothetical protein